MIESTEKYTFVELADESARRYEQPSFHILSENGVRGQILNLRAGRKLGPAVVPSMTVLIGISGEVRIVACDREFMLRSLSQLTLLPNVSFTLQASGDAACELLTIPQLESDGVAPK
ncbi:MAG TPA: hypothetical protein DGB72_05145 [Gemmatimonadetes bacterium]|jgi:hypothetical protein|nr:hypothetical protein [Gemmatimonadota bacterium]